jgi:glycine cleavage system H protein
MSYPEDLKYTGEHEWVRDNGDGTATIGITEFAQGELGDIVFVELNDADEELSQNDAFGTVEAVKTVSDLYAPIDGKILEVNEVLEEEPELVNEDPYGKGWMIKMSISDASQLKGLMDSKAYQKIIA